MPKLPIIKHQELIRVLSKLGYFEHKQKGSHLIMKMPDGKRAVVAVHHGRDIPKGTLKSIINDLEISVEQFVQLLKE